MKPADTPLATPREDQERAATSGEQHIAPSTAGMLRTRHATTVTPDRYLAHLRGTLERIRADGFYKSERVIRTPQTPDLGLAGGATVVNFCANNYLGLADDPQLVAAARDGL